jgi:hypothetical protein
VCGAHVRGACAGRMCGAQHGALTEMGLLQPMRRGVLVLRQKVGVFVTVFTSNAVTSQLFRACVCGASNSDPCNVVRFQPPSTPNMGAGPGSKLDICEHRTGYNMPHE